MRARPRKSAHRSAVVAGYAASMRWAPTPSEALLWSALRGRRLGVLFRRQVIVAGYIADFAAVEARLIVEVDGPYHEQRRRADARRDRALARAGYRVLRVEAQLVVRELPVVVERIRAAIAEAVANIESPSCSKQ